MAHPSIKAEVHLIQLLAQTVTHQRLGQALVLKAAEWLRHNGFAQQHQQLVNTLIDNDGSIEAIRCTGHDHA